ncbi:MAG: hypothetical protein FAF03_07415 [Epsilonproteobacteria bacterium]|nr:hypothetical protein [Campylobacterota bacterium]
MRFTTFSTFLFFISACSSTPDISLVNETDTEQKILSNQSAAYQAQDEYKKLQAQREKE